MAEPSLTNLPTLLRPGMLTYPKVPKTTRPIDALRDALLEVPSNVKALGDRVFVIKAKTASGKSTVIPAMIYRELLPKFHREIIVSQPRILNAQSIASELPANYPDLKLRKNLGYSTGPLRVKHSDKSGITFTNIDYFIVAIAEMTPEEIMRSFSFIIIDECHVSTLALNGLLYVLKNFLKDHWAEQNCPTILLMSATLDENLYKRYFGVPDRNVFICEGFSHPIKDTFATKMPENTLLFIRNIIKHIVETNSAEDNNRHILVFLKGQSEISKMIGLLEEYNYQLFKEKKSGTFIAPIELTSNSFKAGRVEYKNLYSKVNDLVVPILDLECKEVAVVQPYRKVIIATNVAETGVTIEHLKYCIDSGEMLGSEFNPEMGYNVLTAKTITRGMAMQRRGRVGRKCPGEFYACYTRDIFDKMDDFQINIMATDDVSPFLLTFACTHYRASIQQQAFITRGLTEDDIPFMRHSESEAKNYVLELETKKEDIFEKMDLIDIPSAQMNTYAARKLYSLGFFDENCRPTLLGFYARRVVKLSLETIRFLFAGYGYGCNMDDIITICCIIGIGSMKIIDRRYRPRCLPCKTSDKKQMFELGKFYSNILIADSFIDLLFVYQEYLELLRTQYKSKNFIESIQKWCEDQGVIHQGLLEITSLKEEITTNLLKIGLNIGTEESFQKSMTPLRTLVIRDLHAGLEEVAKIKQALYDGFKEYLLIKSADGEYRWKNKTVSLSVPESPKYVLCDGIVLRNIMGNYQLGIKGLYSVLDGIPH
jgi:HrpA-like RNA helicase